MKKTIILSLLLCFSASLAFAQEELSKAEQKFRKKIWGEPSAAFRATETPEKYKNESAVILAKTFEYEFTKLSMMQTLRETMFYQTRIKLLDAAAVKEYSEISFNPYARPSDYHQLSEYRIAIKIVKADKREIVIDNSEKVAMEVQNDYAKAKSFKLAVPNLEVGDIIDYFIYYNFTLTSMAFIMPYQQFIISEQYPIAYYRFSALLQRKTGMNFSGTGGVPELKMEEDKDGDDIRYFEMRNIDKAPDLKWFYPYRVLPAVRFQARMTGHYYNTFWDAKGRSIKTKTTTDEWIKQLRNDKDIDSEISLKSFNKMKKETNINTFLMEAQALHFYTIYTNALLGLGNGSNRVFDVAVANFKKNKIPFKYAYCIPREYITLNDIILQRDVIRGIYIESTKTFAFGSGFFGKVPAYMQGTKVYAMSGLSKKPTLETIDLPAENKNENATLTDINVSFIPDNEENLLIKSKETTLGNNQDVSGLYTEYQFNKQFTDEYASYQMKTPTLQKEFIRIKKEVDDFYKSKKGIKMNEEKRKDTVDRNPVVTASLKKEYETDKIILKRFEIAQLGALAEKSEVIINKDFEIGGLFKKVGENYILDAGKLIGSQLALKKEELIRTQDVYMPYAREFKNTVKITVPAGYSVQGLEKFTYNISNETGGFVSKAELVENEIIITTHKYYNHLFEKAADWDKMTAFLEGCFQFTQQKILLKKNN